jgi:hypothetical protein
MRVSLAMLAALAACGGESEPPRAWQILQTFQFAPEGVDRESSCRDAQYFGRWSYRDLAKTDLRVDADASGERDTCVIPVDTERERFVLQSVACKRTDGAARPVEVSLTLHFGATGGIVELVFPGTPPERSGEVAVRERSFGAGLVVDYDITAFTVGGRGECQIAGYYLDRSAPALGPVRMQTTPRI